jgi:hypothetical protein
LTWAWLLITPRETNLETQILPERAPTTASHPLRPGGCTVTFQNCLPEPRSAQPRKTPLQWIENRLRFLDTASGAVIPFTEGESQKAQRGEGTGGHCTVDNWPGRPTKTCHVSFVTWETGIRATQRKSLFIAKGEDPMFIH